ncbi:MAG: HEAT repeat domain-containing protein, partial [Acidobacteria bacterium]|nr:HEAT repeat domain-containing protein [Acidobacteriota bacterium]
MAANITHQEQYDLRNAAQRVPQNRFLCPNCLNFGEFRYACGYCWEEVKISRWFSTDLENKKCPHCEKSFSPPAEMPWYGLLAQCEHCKEKFDRTIYHHREFRVLGSLQSIDYAQLCHAIIAQETNLRGSRGYICDDGVRLTYLLDLSVLTDSAISLPHAPAWGEIEAIWLDAVEDNSPPWDFELIKMTDRFIAQSAIQSGLKVCISHPELNEVVKNALSARFGIIEYEIAAADFFGTRTNVITRGEVGPKSTVPALCGQLMYGYFRCREKAAEELGVIGDARAVDPLCAALKDKDQNVRRAAAEALGAIGDRRAVEPLCALLKDEDTAVRRTAAEALGAIGDEQAFDPLCVALKDWDRGVRRAVAEALVKIGTVESLCAALKDGDSDVRRAAAEAIGDIADARVVEPLCAALKDWDRDLRRAAAEALVK